jgi:type VI secretion system protein ImpE
LNARELYQAGKLNEAVRALGSEVRDNPGDAQRRTFLFELLCFAGEYDRAEKQLDVLAQGSGDKELAALVYRTALRGEKTRHELFEKREYPKSAGTGQPHGVRGTLNGKPFVSLSDADPRIGAHLEVFAGGAYMWFPFDQIASVKVDAPRRLRDLLWTPAILRARAHAKEKDLGEVLLPALTPFSWKHEDDAVRLGRATVWEDSSEGELPAGQKMLLVDDEEFPLLELRQLEFSEVEKVS